MSLGGFLHRLGRRSEEAWNQPTLAVPIEWVKGLQQAKVEQCLGSFGVRVGRVESIEDLVGERSAQRHESSNSPLGKIPLLL